MGPDLKTAWRLSFSDEMRVRDVLYMRRAIQIDDFTFFYCFEFSVKLGNHCLVTSDVVFVTVIHWPMWAAYMTSTTTTTWTTTLHHAVPKLSPMTSVVRPMTQPTTLVISQSPTSRCVPLLTLFLSYYLQHQKRERGKIRVSESRGTPGNLLEFEITPGNTGNLLESLIVS